MQVTADPDSSVDDLMRVVMLDQSLVTLVLKTANSAFLGLPRKVDSIQQALTILGFAEIQNMALAKGVFDSFKNLKKGNQFDINRFWEHSFLCAISARILAVDFRSPRNDFFLAGLIHDIGKLAMVMWFPAQFSRIIEIAGPLNLRTYPAEKEVLGMTHEDVGMALLDRWLFPNNLISVVGFHHRPREAGNQRLFALVVHIADLLAHLNGCGDNEKNCKNSLGKSLFSAEIANMCESQGIEWNGSVLEKVNQELMRRKEEEAGFLDLLIS